MWGNHLFPELTAVVCCHQQLDELKLSQTPGLSMLVYTDSTQCRAIALNDGVDLQITTYKLRSLSLPLLRVVTNSMMIFTLHVQFGWSNRFPPYLTRFS